MTARKSAPQMDFWSVPPTRSISDNNADLQEFQGPEVLAVVADLINRLSALEAEVVELREEIAQLKTEQPNSPIPRRLSSIPPPPLSEDQVFEFFKGIDEISNDSRISSEAEINLPARPSIRFTRVTLNKK